MIDEREVYRPARRWFWHPLLGYGRIGVVATSKPYGNLRMKRIVFAVLGCITFAFGSIGMFVPVLPTTPFYIATAFFWLNSSEKLHQYLMHNRFYRKFVQEMIVEKKMSARNQIKVLCGVFILLSIPFILIDNLAVRITLVAVFLGHLILLPRYFRKKGNEGSGEERDDEPA
jgi:uncharacterized membrane protein YbaN (DUF454 family)